MVDNRGRDASNMVGKTLFDNHRSFILPVMWDVWRMILERAVKIAGWLGGAVFSWSGLFFINRSGLKPMTGDTQMPNCTLVCMPG